MVKTVLSNIYECGTLLQPIHWKRIHWHGVFQRFSRMDAHNHGQRTILLSSCLRRSSTLLFSELSVLHRINILRFHSRLAYHAELHRRSSWLCSGAHTVEKGRQVSKRQWARVNRSIADLSEVYGSYGSGPMYSFDATKLSP